MPEGQRNRSRGMLTRSKLCFFLPFEKHVLVHSTTNTCLLYLKSQSHPGLIIIKYMYRPKKHIGIPVYIG